MNGEHRKIELSHLEGPDLHWRYDISREGMVIH